MNRREFLSASVGTIAALSVGGILRANEQSAKTVRIGVIGTGGRGIGMLKGLLLNAGVEVPAVCDINEGAAELAAKIVKDKNGNTPVKYTKGEYDYRNLLERDDIDAVMVCTPIKWHADMAIDAMNAGKDVATEVVLSADNDKIWQVVKTKEKTGRHFMMLENYCYSRPNMLVYNMVQQGFFGDVYYGECSYIHNCKSLQFYGDGKLTWRGELVRDSYGNVYPTHAMGPISKNFGLNDGDRITECVAMGTRCRINNYYAAEKFGKDSEVAKIEYKSNGMTTCLLKLANGGMITLFYDTTSPGPMDNFYLLQGNKARYNSRYDSISVGETDQWTKTNEFLEKYDHPYWKKDGPAAENAGHGGGDYFVLRDFVEMVRQNREPWVDVYEAATWSSICNCSRNSLDRGSKPVKVPDFTNGKWKSKTWRDGNMRPA